MQHPDKQAADAVIKDDSDIFLARLQLLIVMSKAYLEGFPIGQHRKQAIIDNANALFYLSLFADFPQQDRLQDAGQEHREAAHALYEKVRLLTVMAKAFAEGRLAGDQKRKELKDNLDDICEAITFTGRMHNVDFLHVA